MRVHCALALDRHAPVGLAMTWDGPEYVSKFANVAIDNFEIDIS